MGGAANGGGTVAGGRGGVGNVAATANMQPTFAQRQIQRQQQDARDQRRAAEERRRAQDLQAEVERLQKELASARKEDGAEEEDADMDTTEDQFATWTEEERQQRIDVVKGGLPYLEILFGADSEEVANAKDQIEALQRASREAKPYRTHRAQLERRKARLDSQQERDAEEAEQLQQQIEAAQERLANVRGTMEERTKNIEKVDAELKELLRKALAEDDEAGAAAAPTAASAPRAQAWSTVEATLSELASSAHVPADQAQQLAGFLALFRQVATNVLASPGGAALATPPTQRWGTTATKKMAGTTDTAAAATGAGDTKRKVEGTANGADAKGGGGNSSASGSGGNGAAQPATPQAQVPRTPTQRPHGEGPAGTGATSSGGSNATGQTTAKPAHEGLLQSPAEQQLWPGGGRRTHGKEDDSTGRRQRSNSCTREQRKAEAGRAAAAALGATAATRGGEARLNSANEVDSGAGTATNADGAGAMANAAMDPATDTGGIAGGSAGASQVQIGTDASEGDADSGLSDVELWSDSEFAGAADVDMDARDGETDEQRKARISKFFKDRMQERARKAKKEGRWTRATRTVRRPRKGE